ncbi:C2 family cysteine protease [Synechococcus sp. MIT S9451]|uniref:C2 family cysteine protease n=1 Tax=Synechococcus sp. MIT S9451 TaxID=3082543 RepID=UPI0039B59128
MLEFNLDGDLFTGFDASNAYQRVAGGDPSAYGLSQQKNLQPGSASDPLSAQDPISALADDDQNQQAATLKPHRPALWNQGTPSQHHSSQPAGVAADPSQTDQGSDRQQDNSDPAQIDQLTGGHQDGRAIASAQQPASAERLELAPADPADLNTAPPQLDQLTGETEAGFFGFMPMPTIFEIDPDVLSYLGERAEVNNLLAEDRFDRDQSTGTETFYNFTWGSGFSANEASGYDVTDSIGNAADIGTVAYRDDKQVIGTVGYGSGCNRDYNDFFSFHAGKSGTYDLSLSNLGANVGLALYDDSGSLVTWSNKWGTQDENISTFLNEGHYTSRIYSYNSSAWNNNGATGFNLNISRQADLFEQVTNCLIDDSSVKNATLNSIKYDYNFDRNDVIGILKSAGDYGSVTNTELTDLRQFWNTFNGTMRADIAGLSKKVVFSDDSNAWYTGYDSIRNELGNLEAGSSTQNLNLLIGKQMLGTDRPMIHTGSYTQAGGSLFVDGINAGDVDQGATGSCYFLSALAGTANEKAELIEDMFTDNGDGTYSVRFYTNGQADYVTVDSMMATKADGTYLHADAGDGTATDAVVADNNELWVALAEKAYAQLNESGRLGQQEATNRYGIASNEGISWGSLTNGIEHVTGLSATWGNVNASGINGVSSAELQALVNGDNVVTVGWSGHARTIMSYDDSTGEYTIRNPYDENHSSLTHAELISRGAFVSWSNT